MGGMCEKMQLKQQRWEVELLSSSSDETGSVSQHIWISDPTALWLWKSCRDGQNPGTSLPPAAGSTWAWLSRTSPAARCCLFLWLWQRNVWTTCILWLTGTWGCQAWLGVGLLSPQAAARPCLRASALMRRAAANTSCFLLQFSLQFGLMSSQQAKARSRWLVLRQPAPACAGHNEMKS